MIKLKSLLVIILSTLLISSVILLTILGLSLYIGWKEREAVKDHIDEIARLNARLYEQFIGIQDLRADYGRKGPYKDKCLLEGMVKNNGYRTISSIKLRVEFLNGLGDSIYIERFLPLKASVMPRATTIAVLSRFISGKETPLLPGQSLNFKHILGEQKNKDIISPIKYKRYATNPNEWSGKINYKITKVRF